MDKRFAEADQRLRAVIHTAQYLAGLMSEREIWPELARVVSRFFAANLVAFAGRRPDGALLLHACEPAEEALATRLAETAGRTVGEVLDNGFLAHERLELAQPCWIAFLPIAEAHRTTTVMLIGHHGEAPLPRELLDVYLAVAGLCETALARLASEAQAKRRLEALEHSMEETIQAVAATIEARDPYTAGHQRRVAALARRIAEEMGLPAEEVRGLYLAATIHDIGKIHIPAEILSFPGKLGEIEYALIKVHVQAGYDILKGIDFPWPVAQMVYQHHEHLDGSGYPRGLKGEAIMRGARILCVADVVESIASHRPYRPGRGIDQALAEIRDNRGRLYDEAAVDACLRLFDAGYAIE